jgi:hypothetical protein
MRAHGWATPYGLGFSPIFGALVHVPVLPQAGIYMLLPLLADEAFDEGVLLRLSGRDVMPFHAAFLRPAEDRHAGQLDAIVGCAASAGLPRVAMIVSRATRAARQKAECAARRCRASPRLGVLSLERLTSIGHRL